MLSLSSLIEAFVSYLTFPFEIMDLHRQLASVLIIIALQELLLIWVHQSKRDMFLIDSTVSFEIDAPQLV